MKSNPQLATAILDFDSPEWATTVLYRAGKITGVEAHDGAICCTFPFLRMDTLRGAPAYRPGSGAPTLTGRLWIKAYGPEVLRVVVADTLAGDASPMLELSPAVTAPSALRVETLPHGWRILDAQGCRRAEIDHTLPLFIRWNGDATSESADTLDLTLFPDAKTAVPFRTHDRFGGYEFDSFSLFRLDRDGTPVRHGFALKAEYPETFHGTGERFTKFDLSGQTLLLDNTDGLGINSGRTTRTSRSIYPAAPTDC